MAQLRVAKTSMENHSTFGFSPQPVLFSSIPRFKTNSPQTLEDCQIFQERYNTDDDDDHLSDLFYFPIEWQHVDEIENEKDNQNCYQKTDEDGHRLSDPSRNGFSIIIRWWFLHNTELNSENHGKRGIFTGPENP